MAEAIFASENVKELAPGETPGLTALALAVCARLMKNFLVRDGPGDAGDRNCKQKQLHGLRSKPSVERRHEQVRMRKSDRLLAEHPDNRHRADGPSRLEAVF
jgi:hypothetical protein